MPINFNKIIGGVNNTLSMVNKAIPIYKQVSPIVKNVRSAFSTVGTINKSVKEEAIKEAKSFERPVSVFKKKVTNEERGNFNLDTLTFFQ